MAISNRPSRSARTTPTCSPPSAVSAARPPATEPSTVVVPQRPVHAWRQLHRHEHDLAQLQLQIGRSLDPTARRFPAVGEHQHVVATGFTAIDDQLETPIRPDRARHQHDMATCQAGHGAPQRAGRQQISDHPADHDADRTTRGHAGVLEA